MVGWCSSSLPEVAAHVQGRLAEEQHESLLLDIRRRKYYKKSRQHLKDSVLKADTEVMAMPEDSELQGAPSESVNTPAVMCCAVDPPPCTDVCIFLDTHSLLWPCSGSLAIREGRRGNSQ